MAHDRVDASRQPLTGSQRRVIAVVFVGMAATTFPISILSVSLPHIARDMNMSTAGITWVVTAPLLASAVAMPVLGKVGDVYGHRRVFIAGFAAATVLALATSFAWNGQALIALRTLGQLCGTATMPSGMAILMTVVRRQERLRVISWWSLVAALSPSLGLVAGGPLIDTIGWRAVFLVQSVPAAVCVVLSLRLLPATTRRPNVSFDVLGALTLGLALLATMFGLNRGAVVGWGNGVVIASILLAPVFVALFVHVERRAAQPLLPLEVLAKRNVSSTLASQPFLMGPFQGAAVVAPFLMESQFGFTATAITLVALSRVIAFGLFGGLAGRAGERLGERRTAAIGTALVMTAMGLLAWSATTKSLPLLIVGMLLTGGGAGFSRPPFTASLTNAVDESELGIATASLTLAGQVGASIVITAMTAVMTAAEGTNSFAMAFAVGAFLSAFAVVFALRLDSAPVVAVNVRHLQSPASGAESP